MPVDTYEAALDEIVEVLTGEFDANDDPAIAWPNVEFKEPVDENWMRVTMLPGTPFRTTIRGARSRFRNPGLLAIQIFTPSEGGDTPALQITERLKPLFRSRNYDGLLFEVPAAQRVGVEAKFLQYNFNAPFRFDDIGEET